VWQEGAIFTRATREWGAHAKCTCESQTPTFSFSFFQENFSGRESEFGHTLQESVISVGILPVRRLETQSIGQGCEQRFQRFRPLKNEVLMTTAMNVSPMSYRQPYCSPGSHKRRPWEDGMKGLASG
jgi:hypothetical protein